MPVFQALKASISNVDTGTASRQEMSSKLLGVDRKALETDPREAQYDMVDLKDIERPFNRNSTCKVTVFSHLVGEST